jgi:hypothetical protein
MAETTTTTLQAAAFNADGTARDQRVDLPAAIFDGTVNVPVAPGGVSSRGDERHGRPQPSPGSSSRTTFGRPLRAHSLLPTCHAWRGCASAGRAEASSSYGWTARAVT